jgi:hypothetical protein
MRRNRTGRRLDLHVAQIQRLLLSAKRHGVDAHVEIRTGVDVLRPLMELTNDSDERVAKAAAAALERINKQE